VPGPAKRLAILAIISVSSCRSSKPEPWYLARIQLDESTLAGNPALGIASAELKRELVAACARTKRLLAIPEQVKPARPERVFFAKLEVAFTRESQGESGESDDAAKAEVGVVLELKRPGAEQRYQASGLGRSHFPPGDNSARSQAFRRALAQALAEAVDAEVLQMGALEKDEPALIADLSASDPRVRDFAVRALAEHKSASAVPALLERLSDPDREVAMRTVGALAAIGDPSAVPALIETTKNRDPEFVRSIVEVIGTIGGQDAEGYLFTLASGHPDESVRNAAELAQARLKARSALGPSPEDAKSQRRH
jgi:hypothetical protein